MAAQATADLRGVARRRGEPEAVMACRLALSIMRELDVQRWSEVAGHPRIGDLLVAPDQRALLVEHAELLPLLRWRSQIAVTVCDRCGRIGLSSPEAKHSDRCLLTFGCDGKVHSSKVTEPSRPKPWEQKVEGDADAG